MYSLSYLYSKFFKNIIRGKSIYKCSIGKDSVIGAGSLIVNCSIGNYSYTGSDCTILNTEIGSYCSIADEVVIGSAEHPMSWVSTSPVFQNVVHSGPKTRFSRRELPKTKRTIIGSDVWIGRRAIIKGGVTVGHGAVIGAGAIVTKDVRPYAIVAGNPARVIRYRFSEDIIEKLLVSKWWLLSPKKIQEAAEHICNPEEFLKHIGR